MYGYKTQPWINRLWLYSWPISIFIDIVYVSRSLCCLLTLNYHFECLLNIGIYAGAYDHWELLMEYGWIYFKGFTHVNLICVSWTEKYWTRNCIWNHARLGLYPRRRSPPDCCSQSVWCTMFGLSKQQTQYRNLVLGRTTNGDNGLASFDNIGSILAHW